MTADQIVSVNALGWAFGAGFGCAAIIAAILAYLLFKDHL